MGMEQPHPRGAGGDEMRDPVNHPAHLTRRAEAAIAYNTNGTSTDGVEE